MFSRQGLAGDDTQGGDVAIKGRAFLYLRGAMIFLALLLPMISLLPLGWLWLWERGYALYWLRLHSASASSATPCRPSRCAGH